VPQPSQRLTGLNVLLVEDELETRNALTWLLRESGAVVSAVGTAAAAYERLQRQSPDVLVSDIGLPGEDGYALLRRARTMWSGRGDSSVPALALTAYARGEDRERALAAGFQAYAAKPVEPEELVSIIATMAGRAQGTHP
jgi:CheY-like chemotaxis protein